MILNSFTILFTSCHCRTGAVSERGQGGGHSTVEQLQLIFYAHHIIPTHYFMNMQLNKLEASGHKF